ncbi:MAG: hypothetical protein LBF68_00160 [Christensenellaceae bacterium]|jgi:hypothetical protein|nr:hypothetical protein [Christensenellaceae bacterium]
MSENRTEKNVFVEKLTNKYGFGHPFFMNEVYETMSDYTQLAASALLFELVDDNLIKRYDARTFYIPQKLPSGQTLPLNPYLILEKKFITDGTSIYGYYLGAQLLYIVGIINTPPAKISIVSEKLLCRTRPITFGNVVCTIHRSKLPINVDLANAHMSLSLFSLIENPLTTEQREKVAKLFNYRPIKIDQLEKFIKKFPVETYQKLVDAGFEVVPN